MVKKKRVKGKEETREVRLNNIFYRDFKQGLEYIKETKNYIFFALGLFLISGVLGFIFPNFFKEQIMALILDLIKQTQGLGTLELIRFIILNNLKSAFFGMTLGVFLGFFPFLILIVNGYVLGFVANKTVSLEGGHILWRLFPHGIFEIPAIMIAAGLGLKLGMFLFVKHKDKRKEFIEWVLNSLRAFIFVILPLLIIAGIIEGILIVVMG